LKKQIQQSISTIDQFFLAAVQGVCDRFGYELGREIVLGPNRQLCINDPDISPENKQELALALEEVVGRYCVE